MGKESCLICQFGLIMCVLVSLSSFLLMLPGIFVLSKELSGLLFFCASLSCSPYSTYSAATVSLCGTDLSLLHCAMSCCAVGGDLQVPSAAQDDGGCNDTGWEEEKEIERLACESDDFVPPKVMVSFANFPQNLSRSLSEAVCYYCISTE